MTVINDSLHVETVGNNDMVDLTPRLNLLLSKHKLKNGSMIVFVPGSTAGITTIEFENGLKEDFSAFVDRIVPRGIRYQHEETWNDGNGHSHIRASLIGPSLTVPFANGGMLLGTWQQVVLVDFDTRHRDRTIHVQLAGE